jgi:alpha-glucosidase (family GH31 glycosyl hydrolase)
VSRAARPALAVLAVVALLTLALPSAAGAAVLRADPAGPRVVDGAGRVVLAGRDGGVAFRAGGAWRRATRVLVAGSGRAVLATDDPRGRRLAVSARAAGEGVVALRARVTGGATGDVEAVRMTFAARPAERFLGFGERSDAVARERGTVESYVAEGPYQPEETTLIAPFIPPWAFRPERRDATTFPVPWLLSTAGHGVLVDGGERSLFRLRPGGRAVWSAEVTGPPAGLPGAAGAGAPAHLELRVFAGRRPAEALRRMTRATGRQPPAVPEALGPWYHSEPGFGDEAAILAKLRAADVPLSVGQIFTQYLPCANHLARRERQRARVRLLHDAGIAATTYVNPMLCPRHPAWDEAVATGALSLAPSGAPATYAFSVRRDLVGQFDFTAPAGRALYGRLLGEALADGHDGWMEDYGEYSPLDARSADGTPGRVLHNEYPTRFHCAAQAAAGGPAGAPLRYVRSGWTGTAPCAPVVWGGDPTTDWGFDGLRSAVRNGLSMGLSGVSTWGSDIGGFFAIGERAVSLELLARWIQLGAASGVMRAQETGIAVPPKDRPRIFEDETLPLWRRYAKLRTQLHPYLAAADAEYARSGLPIMRHLALAGPPGAPAARQDDAYLLGPDLLAAPVLEPGARERTVVPPRGGWVDLWRAARVGAGDGALELAGGRARVLDGGRPVTVPAPVEELPLLVRAGAVLPLLPADVDTLAEHGTDPAIVHRRDRADAMTLLAFPRGRSRAAIGAGEGVRSAERRGAWELRVRGARTRTYRLEAALATLRAPFAPCAVRLDGRALPRGAWSYDPGRAVLVASFRTRAGTFAAEPCPG